jgi:hypothetical protein
MSVQPQPDQSGWLHIWLPGANASDLLEQRIVIETLLRTDLLSAETNQHLVAAKRVLFAVSTALDEAASGDQQASS